GHRTTLTSGVRAATAARCSKAGAVSRAQRRARAAGCRTPTSAGLARGFDVGAALDEDAAVLILQVEQLFPAVTVGADEHHAHLVGPPVGALGVVGELAAAGRARGALPVRSHRPC